MPIASAQKSHPLKRLVIVLLAIFVVTCCILLLFLATLSWTTPGITKTYLNSKGYDFSAKQTSINIFRGRIKFNDVRFAKQSVPDPGKTLHSDALKLSELKLDFSLWTLLKYQEISLTDFVIDGLSIPVEKNGNLYSLANIAISPNDSPAEEPVDNQTKEANTLPKVNWRSLELKNISLMLENSKESDKSIQLDLKNLLIGAFNTQNPNQQTPFDALLAIEEFSLSLNGSSQLISSELQGSTEVDLEKLDTRQVLALISFLPDHLLDKESIEQLLTNEISAIASFQTKVFWDLNDKAPSIELKDNLLNLHNYELMQSSEETQTSASGIAQISIENFQFALSDSQYRVDQITLADASVDFSQKSELGDTSLAIRALEANIDKIVSSQPNDTSQLSLSGKLGEFGKFEIEGLSSLLDFTSETNLGVQSNQIDLIQLSALIESTIARSIESGQLSSQSKITINNGQLEVNNDLRLDQFQLAKKDSSEQDDPLELGIPLNTALNLLRDKNDRIELDLPVSGGIDDPKFSIQPTINKALFKSIKTGVMTQVGPLLAISALGKARDLKDALALKPIIFDNQSTKLNTDAKSSIDAFAALLKKRESISLRLCPFYTSAEKNGVKLSEERVVVIKQALLDAGIDGQRIVACTPGLGSDDLKSPLVEANF